MDSRDPDDPRDDSDGGGGDATPLIVVVRHMYAAKTNKM
jgi:hypothetical protein